MNILWDTETREFVAEFSSDFSGDLEAVKAAGFRTNGPPEWRWYAPSPGTTTLNRLRANRPTSGLTISQEALTVYQPLAEREAKNDEVRKQLSTAKKQANKERKQKERLSDTQAVFGDKDSIGIEDLPIKAPFVSSNPVVPFPGEVKLCEGCGDRLYPYDYPDLCLWCSKNNVLEDIF